MNRDFGSRGGRANEWDPQKKPRTHWEGAPAENAAFEEYYKTQGICPEEEWGDFMSSLRRQLPLTFRINGGGKFAEELRGKLESDFFAGFASGSDGDGDGETIAPPLALPWYPNKLAWQLDFTRTQLRKIDRLKALHEFMKRESDVGSITRQEAVSMVPPLFMDVQPHHRVLDMCAAPGSKTAQLLEALHCNGEPSGVVVANDADVQRCNMLTHQTQRIRSPAMIITNHEAQRFPLLWDLNPESSEERVRFDRILCDVPCSGDGTLRKQPDIWRKWSPANGNGLHIIQLRITLRACELLKTGGRLVYSTCSFNPVEDEAVVAEVLRRTNGSMVLLDVSSELPELKRQPGLCRWKVKDGEKWCDRWEDCESGGKIGATLFPGPDDEGLPLERCMRFLPHHQNTGGFFVAVLQKVAPVTNLKYPQSTLHPKKSSEQQPTNGLKTASGNEEQKNAVNDLEKESDNFENADDDSIAVAPLPRVGPWCSTTTPPKKELPAWGVRGGGNRNRESGPSEGKDEAEKGQDQKDKRQGGGKWKGIDPVVPFIDAGHLAAIQEFYGLPTDCPVLCDSLIARSHEPRPKKLSYLNPGAKLLLRMDVHEQIKVTAAGLKIFERQDTKDVLLSCLYRIAQEGLPYILPYLTRQKFQPTIKELLHILEDRVVSLPVQCKVHITKWKSQPTPAAGDGNEDGDAANDNNIDTNVTTNNSNKNNDIATDIAKTKTDPRFELEDPLTLKQLEQVEYGCCVAILRDDDVTKLGLLAQSESPTPVAVACWRGRGSLNVLMSKQECEQMVDRLKLAMTEK